MLYLFCSNRFPDKFEGLGPPGKYGFVGFLYHPMVDSVHVLEQLDQFGIVCRLKRVDLTNGDEDGILAVPSSNL